MDDVIYEKNGAKITLVNDEYIIKYDEGEKKFTKEELLNNFVIRMKNYIKPPLDTSYFPFSLGYFTISSGIDNFDDYSSSQSFNGSINNRTSSNEYFNISYKEEFNIQLSKEDLLNKYYKCQRKMQKKKSLLKQNKETSHHKLELKYEINNGENHNIKNGTVDPPLSDEEHSVNSQITMSSTDSNHSKELEVSELTSLTPTNSSKDDISQQDVNPNENVGMITRSTDSIHPDNNQSVDQNDIQQNITGQNANDDDDFESIGLVSFRRRKSTTSKLKPNTDISGFFSEPHQQPSDEVNQNDCEKYIKSIKQLINNGVVDVIFLSKITDEFKDTKYKISMLNLVKYLYVNEITNNEMNCLLRKEGELTKIPRFFKYCDITNEGTADLMVQTSFFKLDSQATENPFLSTPLSVTTDPISVDRVTEKYFNIITNELGTQSSDLDNLYMVIKNKKNYIGINSVRNGCYINCVLQMLLQNKYFCHEILYIKKMFPNNTEKNAIEALHELIRRYYTETTSKLVIKFNKESSDNVEKYIADVYHYDGTQQSAYDQYISQFESIDKIKNACTNDNNISFFDNIFMYMFKKRVCKECSDCTMLFERHSIISVPIEMSIQNHEDTENIKLNSLENCLGYFFDGRATAEKMQCTYCKNSIYNDTKIEVLKYPRYFYVDLKRNKFVNIKDLPLQAIENWSLPTLRSGEFLNIKLTDPVTIPFDLTINNEQNKYKTNIYKLKGFIQHSGLAEGGGHYVYYGLNDNDNKWYVYNDSTVNRVDDVNDVLNISNIYYYERKAI